MTADDYLEATIHQRQWLEDTPPVVQQTRVCVFCENRGVVVEADPSRRHDIGVDVIEQIIDGEILHSQIKTFVELLTNQIEIFCEEQHPFVGVQFDFRWGPRSTHPTHLLRDCREYGAISPLARLDTGLQEPVSR